MSNVSNSALDSDPPAFYVMPEDTTMLPAYSEVGDVSIIIPQNRTFIYGRKCASSYPGDADYIASAEARGYIYGEWFSELCPDGELGTNHVSRLIEISREQFERARDLGWPNYYNREEVPK